jgi:tetratricopeptide (TPR) repeat protein
MTSDLDEAREAHYVHRDSERAAEAYERAIAHAEREGDAARAAAALIGIGTLRLEQGWLADATAMFADARERTERVPSPHGEELRAQIAILEAENALRSGDLARARTGFEDALEQATRTQHHLGLALMASARVAQDDGDFELAAATMERARAAFEREGDPRRATILGVRTAVLALERGDVDAALALLEDARASARAPLDPFVVRELQLYSAMALALAGRTKEADAAVGGARELRGAGGASRHFRHVIALTQALVDVSRSDATEEVTAAARRELDLAKRRGPDGVSASNCFYIVRVAARLLERALPRIEPAGDPEVPLVHWPAPPGAAATTGSGTNALLIASLTEIATAGIAGLVTAVLAAEAELYVKAAEGARDRRGEPLVARHGRARPRVVPVGPLAVTISAPRVRDRRVVRGVSQKYVSRLLPPNRPPVLGGGHRLVAAWLRAWVTGDVAEVRRRLDAVSAPGIDEAVAGLVAQREAWRSESLADLRVARLAPFAVPIVHVEGEPRAALFLAAVLPSGSARILDVVVGGGRLEDEWRALVDRAAARGLAAIVS